MYREASGWELVFMYRTGRLPWPHDPSSAQAVACEDILDSLHTFGTIEKILVSQLKGKSHKIFLFFTSVRL